MYPGENINSLNLDLLNFDDVFVVVTDKPDDLNGCGHIGLKIGVKGTDKDYFIHVPGPHQIGDRFSENLKRFYGLYITPQYMPYLEYQNYFTSNGYKVVSKDKIPLDSKGRKAKIKAKLESFQDKPKTYGFIVKNCMTFVMTRGSSSISKTACGAVWNLLKV